MGSNGGSTLLTMLVIFAAFILMMYFLSVRPMQKKMQQQQAVIDSIKPGARVLLASGAIATVRQIGKTQAIVELAPGVEIAVLRQSFRSVLAPEDDEFEFDETLDQAPLGSSDPDLEEAMTVEDFTPEPRDND